MSVNLIVLVGHLTNDPELRSTPSGTSVVNVGLATNHKYKDKETVAFHRLVLWGRQGEILAQYCKKGAQIYCEGRIDYREWEKDGVKRTSAEVIVNQFQMLGGKKGSDERPADGNVRAPSDYAKAKEDPPIDPFHDKIPFAKVDWRAS